MHWEDIYTVYLEVLAVFSSYCNGAMVQWFNGTMVQWLNGAMVHIIMVGAYYQAWWEERAEPY